MLSRKVITRRGRKFRGKFPSTKMGRMVAWESLLERDAILLLELSPGVAYYQEQPTIIEYFDGTRIREYYPDFELTLLDDSLCHLEVKPSEELAKPEVHSKYERIVEHYQKKQFDFRIATDLEIRREPLFSNLGLIADAHAHFWHPLPADNELALFFQKGAQPLHHCDLVLGAASTRRLIARGKLVCDLEQSLTVDTSIYLHQGEQNASILL